MWHRLKRGAILGTLTVARRIQLFLRRSRRRADAAYWYQFYPKSMPDDPLWCTSPQNTTRDIRFLV